MNDYYIFIFAIIGILTTLLYIAKAMLFMIDFLFFRKAENEERQMLHDLITDCEDYRTEVKE